MARYIDADKLIKSFELSIKSWGRDCNSSAPIMMRAYQDALYRVKDMPTADVVPKSEVEKLKADVEVWKQNRFNIFQRLECYEMARQEVAREIFEEIEKEAFYMATDYGEEVKVIAYEDIAELKKKYTEEKKDGNEN